LVRVARAEHRLRAVADTLPVATEILVADLTSRPELALVEERLADRDRPVELLVNNAGAATHGDLLTLSPEALTDQVELGVLAVVRLTRALLPGLCERGRGGIVNVSSTASTAVAPQLPAYAAAKAFVDSWSRSTARAVAGAGVTITCVRPGYTRTSFHARAGQDVTRVPEVYWLEADQVAAQALRAFDAGKTMLVPRGSRPQRVRALTRRYATRWRGELLQRSRRRATG
jgi:short-subunit dehydrogenase